jgi:hypothetical protein
MRRAFTERITVGLFDKFVDVAEEVILPFSLLFRWGRGRLPFWMALDIFWSTWAPFILPLSTYTQWYWKIDLHNLLHFLTLRVDAHAQWEIQQFARIMAGMLKRVAPLSYEAWIDYEVCGARLSRMELDLIRSLRNVGYETLLEDLAKETDPPGGMTAREFEEFTSLFADRPVPDFELDLASAKDSSFFEDQAAAAVPKTA